MTADESTMTADQIWKREVDEVPLLRDALAQAGDSGAKTRGRARKVAEKLDAESLDEGEIALALQEAAAQGEHRRRRIQDARERLHDENDGLSVREPYPVQGRRSFTMLPGQGKYIAAIMVVVVVGIIGPTLLLEGLRGRSDGPILAADEGAFWSGMLSVAAALGWFFLRDAALEKVRAGRKGVIAIPVILGVLTGAALLTVLLTARYSDAGVVIGALALAAATVLYGVSAYLATRRPDPRAVTLRDLDGALAPESDHDAMVRRTAYAVGVRVLLQREAIDAATARTLLRVYAR